MALRGFYGSRHSLVGPLLLSGGSPVAGATTTLDTVNEAVIMVGYVETSDGLPHTIDATGASSIAWTCGSRTFANAGTALKVGIAAVDTAAGPPVRAVNVANVITFDVSKTLIGGADSLTSNTGNISVPDTGSKTIANGDLVAVCIQMTARGGSDSVIVWTTFGSANQTTVTTLAGGIYSNSVGASPNAFITFSDGAKGWCFGSDVWSWSGTRLWNSGGATKEYGQLYQFPFPFEIHGIYGWVGSGGVADFSLVLYSDPLGTPVAEKTVSIDGNSITGVTARYIEVLFPSPFTTTSDQLLAVAFKPGASNLNAYYKTLLAGQIGSDVWGTNGYGISRATGAFTAANSGLDQHYIGLIAGAFNEAGGAPVLGGSVIS